MPAEVLWPEREDLYSLMLLRATIGEGAFASEKQNDPSDPGSREWPPEYFGHAAFWFDEWPEKLVVKTIALDPSKGRDSRQGDYSAIVVYGRDAKGVEYVEADLARRPVNVMCQAFARIARASKPDAGVLEGNAWQDLLAAPLRAALEDEGADLAISTCDNTAPKPVRIRRLTGSLCQRRMRFRRRSPGTALLVQQLEDFPNGSHDDGPDALEMARRKAIEIHNGRRQTPQPRRYTT